MNIEQQLQDITNKTLEWNQYAVSCSEKELDTVLYVVEGLAVVRARMQALLIRQLREQNSVLSDPNCNF